MFSIRRLEVEVQVIRLLLQFIRRSFTERVMTRNMVVRVVQLHFCYWNL